MKLKFQIIDNTRSGFGRYCPTFAKVFGVVANAIRAERLKREKERLEWYLKDKEREGYNHDDMLEHLRRKYRVRTEARTRTKKFLVSVFGINEVFVDNSKTGIERYFPTLEIIREFLANKALERRLKRASYRLLAGYRRYGDTHIWYSPKEKTSEEWRQCAFAEITAGLSNPNPAIRLNATYAFFNANTCGDLLDRDAVIPKFVVLLTDENEMVRLKAFEFLEEHVVGNFDRKRFPLLSAEITKLLQSAEFTALAQFNTPAYAYAAGKCAELMAKVSKYWADEPQQEPKTKTGKIGE